MKYTDWITELKNNLLGVSETERRRVLDYYAEAYADRRAAGFSESEIIDGFGAPFDAAQAILENDTLAEDTPNNSIQVAKTEDAAPPPKQKKKQHKLLKMLLIIAGIVIIVAVGIFALVTVIGRALFKSEFTDATYVQESEHIESISLDFNAGEFKTEFYDGDKIKIEYFESNVYDVIITENDGTLSFRIKTRLHLFWADYEAPDVTVVKLPKSNIYNLKVDIAAGTIDIEGGTFGDMNIDMAAGTANLNGNFECKNFNIDLSAGTVNLNGYTVCDKLKIDLSAGKVFAGKVDCSSLIAELSAGKVKISELTCPIIDVDTAAGTVDLNVNGIKGEYYIKVDKSAGSCNVSDQTGTDYAKKITVDISAGAVNINFSN